LHAIAGNMTCLVAAKTDWGRTLGGIFDCDRTVPSYMTLTSTCVASERLTSLVNLDRLFQFRNSVWDKGALQLGIAIARDMALVAATVALEWRFRLEISLRNLPY
jgi:hypothetical protein